MDGRIPRKIVQFENHQYPTWHPTQNIKNRQNNPVLRENGRSNGLHFLLRLRHHMNQARGLLELCISKITPRTFQGYPSSDSSFKHRILGTRTSGHIGIIIKICKSQDQVLYCLLTQHTFGDRFAQRNHQPRTTRIFHNSPSIDHPGQNIDHGPVKQFQNDMGTTIEEEQAVSRDYQGEDPVEQSNSS